MPAALKNLYSESYYSRLSEVFSNQIVGFNSELFSSLIFVPEFEQMELKQRMRHTTKVIRSFLNDTYPEALSQLLSSVRELARKQNGNGGLADIVFPDFVEVYGLEYFDESIAAIEEITQFITCEFAVRPFLIRYPDQMIKVMLEFAKHPDHRVRRLASEGSRPRLPWAQAVPALKESPIRLLPILELLKNDPSEWVRRSVANHLNDIAKDHPEMVMDIAKRWRGLSKETDAVIRHGVRTLLKNGNPDIMSYYSLSSEHLEVSNLIVNTAQVKFGSALEFSLKVANLSDHSTTLRLEYAIDFRKANGLLSAKVFKISETKMEGGEQRIVNRKHSFKPITTRVYYPGEHFVSIVVNGRKMATASFMLIR